MPMILSNSVWQRNDAPLLLCGELGDGTHDLRRIVNTGSYRLNTARASQFLDRSPELFVRGRFWVHKDQHACCCRRGFPQNLEPLAAHGRLEVSKACDVPTRVG